MIPLGRLGEISDLMGGFVFLASEASSLNDRIKFNNRWWMDCKIVQLRGH